MKHDPDGFRRTVEGASRTLFKRQHRIAVLGYIAFSSSGVVYAREIARRLGVGDNQVSPEFEAMRVLGALELVQTPDREQWHRRVGHPLWPFTRNLFEHLAASYDESRPTVVLEAYLRDVLQLAPDDVRAAVTASVR